MTTYDLTHLTSELERKHVPYELIAHRRSETAGDEARAIGIAPEQVAKTIVLATKSGYVRAVLPASARIDLYKARELLAGDKQARLATESELALAYPMFEVGAVPPFGGPAGDRVIVDRRLSERESVMLDAGSHTQSLQMSTSDLIGLTGAEVADIAAD